MQLRDTPMKPVMPWKPGLCEICSTSPPVEDAHCQRVGMFQSSCQATCTAIRHCPRQHYLSSATGWRAHGSHCRKSPSCYPCHMPVINDIKTSLDSAKILANLEPQPGYDDQMGRDWPRQLWCHERVAECVADQQDKHSSQAQAFFSDLSCHIWEEPREPLSFHCLLQQIAVPFRGAMQLKYCGYLLSDLWPNLFHLFDTQHSMCPGALTVCALIII